MFSSKEIFKEAYSLKVNSLYAKPLEEASPYEKYYALGALIRDYINENWIRTNAICNKSNVKQVYYFSMEFLLGKMLDMNLINLGLKDLVVEALQEFDIDLDELIQIERDPGLGNGGLGRLAACFMDSLASLNISGHGCGIRYKYGLFEQKIVNGHQVELPDSWLEEGNVWEIRRSDQTVEVRFGGKIVEEMKNGRQVFKLQDYSPIKAVPYDIPVIGYDTPVVNTLRLWSAESIGKDFDFSYFSRGEYLKAIEDAYQAEAISEILYPDDNHYSGRILRLKQEYFLVSAGLQSIINNFKKCNKDIVDLAKGISIHVNDTHPAIAVPELMRILMDQEGLGWDEAWDITVATISYTNHTILAEALEKWPVDMIKELLPRIYMIIHEINERFCKKIFDKYGDFDKVSDMAIIAHGYVKMAHLVIVGSHSINGVAKLHTEILKNKELANFYNVYKERFNNKTNGITHRRWLLKANPKLTSLITETIGDSWIKNTDELSRLKNYAKDRAFQDKIEEVKKGNKLRLIKHLEKTNKTKIDPNSIFDVHVKRLHGYKRQMMNVLHIMHLYNKLLENPNLDMIPRTFIFGAKAAPGYHYAKTVIKLINSLAERINNDSFIQDKIKVVFLENYNVSIAEVVIPAADVSEQISTASKEASGTGNMKFMMNGAITIATLDGANIEMLEQAGKENMVIFGLTSNEVLNYYKNGCYNSYNVYMNNPDIKLVMDQLINGFLPGGTNEFMSIFNSLITYNDEFFVLEDFTSYAVAHKRIDELVRNRNKWLEMCINNIGSSGTFSSDRTIREYCSDIWKVSPIEF